MNKINKFNSARMHGFTLVELLVVIGILAILTAIVLVAINPGRQLAQSRNTSRQAAVNSILGAITAELADPDSTLTLPAVLVCDSDADGVRDQWSQIWADDTAVPANDEVDFSLLIPDYIAALPEDPTDTAALGETGYNVCTDATAIRYTVCANTIEAPATEAPCVTR